MKTSTKTSPADPYPLTAAFIRDHLVTALGIVAGNTPTEQIVLSATPRGYLLRVPPGTSIASYPGVIEIDHRRIGVDVACDLVVAPAFDLDCGD